MVEPTPPATEPVEEFQEDFFHEHKAKIIAGTVAAALIIVASGAIQFYRHDARQAAIADFARARSDEGYRQVIADHENSPVSVDARLLLAASLREAGDFAGSDKLLNEVVERSPDHPLAPTAQLGLAANLEAQDKIEDAIDRYRQISVSLSASYAAPLALLGEARLLVLQEKHDDARRVYENLATQFADSPAGGTATNQLRLLPKPSPPAPKDAAPGGPNPPK